MIHRAIKAFRQYNKMTQAEVAQKLSISKSYLSEIESGKKTISIDLLEKIAEMYDMPVSSLIFFSETMNSKDAKVSEKFRGFVSSKVLSALEWVIERDSKEKAVI
ncbi:helix-turn-helix transcriptional regulator [Thiomicrorhabdus sp.]|uniref:helix-turn-helix domain-containing protein n=1 Tax=Thiomicrorhabdus sp. TaxID=2039724 RepID=UPI002AA91E3A|nr:helix-turn-helix transcriptional regulator [Thiomicrorhabdus sp.]